MKSFANVRTDLKALTGRLILVCAFASVGAFSFGYDNGWWGMILGAAGFNNHYGNARIEQPDGTIVYKLDTSQTSVGSSMGIVGMMVGCAIAPFPMARLGRRWTFFILAVIGIIGPIVQAISTIPASYPCLIVGKLILGISMGMASASIGAYLAECAPPNIRGLVVNFYGAVLNCGYVISIGICYAVIYRTTKIQWMLPISFQVAGPLVLATASFMLPESPRWLITNGKIEEAEKVLATLHGLTREEAVSTVSDVEFALKEESRRNQNIGFLDLFRGSNLRRTMIAIGIQCIQQAQGISFVATYIVLTFQNLGYTNAYVINVGVFVEYAVCSWFAFVTPDLFGRRQLLIVASSIMAASMFVMGGISTAYAQPTGHLANFLIAAYVIWIAIFASSWSTVPWIISSEVSSQPLREKTLALSAFCGYGVSLLATFVVPYIQDTAYGNLHAKISFVWAGFSTVTIAYVYFVIPETGNRTLEELDLMFEAGISSRRFATFDTTELLAARQQASRVDEVRLDDKAMDGFKEDIDAVNIVNRGN